MLTSVTISLALAVLLALTIIWGRRQRALAIKYRNQAWHSEDLLIRSADYGRQWREEAVRLRQIVDRVES